MASSSSYNAAIHGTPPAATTTIATTNEATVFDDGDDDDVVGCGSIRCHDVFPNVRVSLNNKIISANEIFKDEMGVIIGVVGAFNPICSEVHLPGFLNNIDEFHQRGINRLICVTVNDPFVVKAWKGSLGVTDQISFLCDTTGKLSRDLGLLCLADELGMGYRCKRCAMIIGPGSEVLWIGYGPDAYAPRVLREVERLAARKAEDIVDMEELIKEFLEGKPINMTELESKIKGEPFDGLLRPQLEMRRSQCDFLYEEAPDEEATDLLKEELPFSQAYSVDVTNCSGLSYKNMEIIEHDSDEHDIKFKYSKPATAEVARSKGGSASPWNVSIVAKEREFGYVVVDGVRYYTRNVHFHSPSLHISESHPLELHIVHTPKNTEGSVMDKVVVVCLMFVWEPENDDTKCEFIESVINAVLSKHFKSNGSLNTINCEDFAFDLQKLLAENTMAAFYRYSTTKTDAGEQTGPLTHKSTSSPPQDMETIWLVARHNIPLSWKHFEPLHLILGTPAVIDNSDVLLSKSVGRLCNSRRGGPYQLKKSSTMTVTSLKALDQQELCGYAVSGAMVPVFLVVSSLC